jgi:hypothetical protein
MENGCEKYIPDQYLLAPIADRLQLLAGLIDTDGYVYHANGRVVFVTADESMMVTFKRLLASFGWHASVDKVPPRGFAGAEATEAGQDCYYIGFSRH